MLRDVEEGKCKHIIIFSFSRFTRSCSHLLKSLEFLEKHNCRFTSVTEQIDTSTIMGKVLTTLLGALAEMERQLIVQRVRAGLARAKASGQTLGRKKTRPSQLIQKVLIRGVTYREAAHLANSSQGSIALEAKQMRKDVSEGRLPEFLTLKEVRESTFFAGYSSDVFDLIEENIRKKKIQDLLPPLPERPEPVAEMQTVSTVI